MRFDVYGRFEFIVERLAVGSDDKRDAMVSSPWRVLQVGVDGKRGLRDDNVIPTHLSDDDVAQYLNDLLHQSGRPEARVRRAG